jgi:hypothetical protein
MAPVKSIWMGRIPFDFDALHYSGASVVEKANVAVRIILRILGHEKRTTTEIYLYSIGQSEREAMVVFERGSRKSRIQTLTPRIY